MIVKIRVDGVTHEFDWQPSEPWDVEYRPRMGGFPDWVSLGHGPMSKDQAEKMVKGSEINEGKTHEFRAIQMPGGMVHMPGVMSFYAANLGEAKDIARSLVSGAAVKW